MSLNISYRTTLAMFLATSCLCLNTAAAIPAEQTEFHVLVGDWVRSDSGYRIHVKDVMPDGLMDAGYFNPQEIKTSEAKVSLWSSLKVLFIKLQDEGYPGSTYTLYYSVRKRMPW